MWKTGRVNKRILSVCACVIQFRCYWWYWTKGRADYRWIRTFTPFVAPHSCKFESCTRPEINDRSRKSFISALEQCEFSSLIENRGCGLLLRNMLLRAQQMPYMNIYFWIMNDCVYEWHYPFCSSLKVVLEYCQFIFWGVNGRGNELKNLTKVPEHNRYWVLTKHLQ